MSSIIIKNVLLGTIIVTDKWLAYKKALENNTDYEHLTINHSINFVDTSDPTIHTQNIEGLWSSSKFFIRKRKGLSQEKHSELLIQFLFEYRTEKNKDLTFY